MLVLFSILAVSVLGLVPPFYHGGESESDRILDTSLERWTVSRGTAEGVSEKSNGPILGAAPAYPWTNAMLLWQRTAYHFQPRKNWMNGSFLFTPFYFPSLLQK